MAENNYICNYVRDNLPWYERDGLLTYIDKLRYDKFLENPDKHFEETKIVNFDIIYKSIRVEKNPEQTIKDYQTVKDERVTSYPKEDQNKFLSSAFSTDRKEFYFEKKVIDNYFK